MHKGTFVRARSPEHKEQRREAILAAARELARRDGVRTVSLASVAAEVGVVKSNLARYFATREEIYLALAIREWTAWEEAVLARLEGATSREEAVDALVDTCVERPLFCDLVSHSSISLEHNVTKEALREFKLSVLGVIGRLADAFVKVCPSLNGGEAREVVAGASGLAATLYPAANPPPALRELYETDPEVAAACIPFGPTLKRVLLALMAGLPTLR